MKKKPGRPTKFNLTKLTLAGYMARDGKTDVEIAAACEVTFQTVANWKKKHPQFFETIKKEKEVHDGKVEAALVERALGFDTVEYEYRDRLAADGKTWELIPGSIRKVKKKHVPPDVASIVYWLSNRQGDRWRRNADNNNKGAEDIAEALKDLVKKLPD